MTTKRELEQRLVKAADQYFAARTEKEETKSHAAVICRALALADAIREQEKQDD